MGREPEESGRSVRLDASLTPMEERRGGKEYIGSVLDYVIQFQEYFGKANVSGGGDISPWTRSIPVHSWSGSLKQGLSVSCY